MSDSLRERLEALRVILSERAELAPFIRSEIAILINDTIAALGYSREAVMRLELIVKQRDEDYRHLEATIANVPRPLSEWDEDFGTVMWWKLPVDEPAWIGHPGNSDWPGYHTHWTPHPPIPELP